MTSHYVYEITTHCGAKIQTGRLDPAEQLGIVYCPIECPQCGQPHGTEIAIHIKRTRLENRLE